MGSRALNAAGRSVELVDAGGRSVELVEVGGRQVDVGIPMLEVGGWKSRPEQPGGRTAEVDVGGRMLVAEGRRWKGGGRYLIMDAASRSLEAGCRLGEVESR